MTSEERDLENVASPNDDLPERMPGTFEPPEINVSLEVFGSATSPSGITEILGIAPTRTWSQGDPVQGTLLKRRDNRWILQSSQSDSLQVAIDSVLNAVWHVAARFSSLPPDAKVQLYCVIYDVERSVPLSFPARVIAKLATLQAELNVVYYNWPPDPDNQ